jgi:hypothetical protein
MAAETATATETTCLAVGLDRGHDEVGVDAAETFGVQQPAGEKSLVGRPVGAELDRALSIMDDVLTSAELG